MLHLPYQRGKIVDISPLLEIEDSRAYAQILLCSRGGSIWRGIARHYVGGRECLECFPV
jgi:hypothetical protein